MPRLFLSMWSERSSTLRLVRDKRLEMRLICQDNVNTVSDWRISGVYGKTKFVLIVRILILPISTEIADLQVNRNNE